MLSSTRNITAGQLNRTGFRVVPPIIKSKAQRREMAGLGGRLSSIKGPQPVNRWPSTWLSRCRLPNPDDELPSVAKPIAQKVIQIGDVIDLPNRCVFVVIDSAKGHGVTIQGHIR